MHVLVVLPLQVVAEEEANKPADQVMMQRKHTSSEPLPLDSNCRRNRLTFSFVIFSLSLV